MAIFLLYVFCFIFGTENWLTDLCENSRYFIAQLKNLGTCCKNTPTSENIRLAKKIKLAKQIQSHNKLTSGGPLCRFTDSRRVLISHVTLNSNSNAVGLNSWVQTAWKLTLWTTLFLDQLHFFVFILKINFSIIFEITISKKEFFSTKIILFWQADLQKSTYTCSCLFKISVSLIKTSALIVQVR